MQTNFFTNTGGLNVTDGPFAVQPNQAVAGWNFEYTRKGAIVKSKDRVKLNSVANGQLRTLGLGLNNTKSSTKAIIRAAGTQIQVFDPDSGTFTSQNSDTASPTAAFWTTNTTQPVCFSDFNTTASNTLWMAGGGATNIVGYTGTNVTTNGSPSPLGTLVLANLGSATGGGWTTTGTYFYALALRKLGTQALSNAALDVSVAIATTTDTIRLTFPSVDATLYDQWYVYRSAVGGVTAFTAGTLVAQVPTSRPTYTDTGDAAVATAQVVPRAGNTTDNSVLPNYTSGIYTWAASAVFVSGNNITFSINSRAYSVPFTTDNATTLQAIATAMAGDQDVASAISGGTHTITLTGRNALALSITGSVVTGGASQATILVTTLTVPVTLNAYSIVCSFKRRLVSAQGSTLYLSELDKPEAWPITNRITLPTGGSITAVAAIGFNGPISSSIDEYLVIWKETETWVLTGNGISDWVLKFVDNVGCAGQGLVVPASGYLAWIDYRGVYLWNGVGKPVYISRLIEAYFYVDGDLDKPKLSLGWGQYYRKQSLIVWYLSHRTKGENSFLLKLDLRLSSGQVTVDMDKQVVDAIFTPGFSSHGGVPAPMYGGISYIPTTTKDEAFLVGDGSGNMFRTFYGYTADGEGVSFEYETAHMDLGLPSMAKRFKKIVVWVDSIVPGNLTLNYWADYRARANQESQTLQDMGPTNPAVTAASLWNVAIWDQSLWDDYQPTVKGLVYNLSPAQNNAEGDSLKLKFSNSDINMPITIHGFTVFWEEAGLRK